MERVFLATKSSSSYFVLLVCFLIGCGSLVQAQSSRQISAVERRIETVKRQATEFERDNMGRNGEPDNSANAKWAKQIKAEIVEDLNGLQAAYNEVVFALQSRREFTDDMVNRYAATIGKHAVRLKSNLALPEPDENQKKDAAEIVPENSRKTLIALCSRIFSFITNPILETTIGLDIIQAAKARRDLDAIIEFAAKLSETFKTTKQN